MELAWWDGALIVTAALLAGGHCLGMCGGLVTACVMTPGVAVTGVSPWHPRRWVPLLGYHGGRIGTYALIGALAGWVGSLGTVTAPLAAHGPLIRWLAGGMMVLFGLSMAGWLPGWQTGGGVGTWAGKILRRFERGRGLALGVLTGLLPCPLHWAFQAKALATGSVGGGMGVMVLFGLGSAVPLSLLGVLVVGLGVVWRQRLMRLAGVLVVVMGVLTVARGGHAHHGEPPAPAAEHTGHGAAHTAPHASGGAAGH